MTRLSSTDFKNSICFFFVKTLLSILKFSETTLRTSVYAVFIVIKKIFTAQKTFIFLIESWVNIGSDKSKTILNIAMLAKQKYFSVCFDIFMVA